MASAETSGERVSYDVPETVVDHIFFGVVNAIERIPNEAVRGVVASTLVTALAGPTIAKTLLQDAQDRLAKPQSKRVDVGLAFAALSVPSALLATTVYRHRIATTRDQ